MKKSLLFIAAILTITYSDGFGQTCTPTLPPDGIHSHIVPDTIVNLPHAMVGQPYSTDIQIRVGTDTAVTTPINCNMHIVNYTLTSVDGLPTGFSYTTNPSNGVFPGGSSACMHAVGTAPTAGMEGTYPLVVNVTANVTCNGFPLSQPSAFNGYKIVIDPAGTVGISTNAAEKFELGQNIPNPSSDLTRIMFTSTRNEKIELNIFNAIGQSVLKQPVDAVAGSNEINVSTSVFADGIYIYTLRNADQTLTKRMVITKK
jgi:hypothetical protein